MAEEEGFEPPIPFQVRQFSRLEPSTTRPLFLDSSLVRDRAARKDILTSEVTDESYSIRANIAPVRY